MMGREIEIDTADNLYLVNSREASIERLSPSLEETSFLKIRENSEA
jgi:hypothetical protein